MQENEKIRILHLRSSGGFYGAESVILNLLTSMDSDDLSNCLVCVNNRKNPHVELVNEAKKAGICADAVDCSGIIDFKFISELRRIIKTEKINILHCHDYKACMLGFLASFGLKINLVATNHLWTRANFKLRCYESLEGILYNQFGKVVAVSEKIKRELRPFLISKSKIRVIPNGIDLKKFRKITDEKWSSEKRIELGITQNDIVIGNIARLSLEKNQAGLLKGFFQLLKKIEDRGGVGDSRNSIMLRRASLKLLIAGDGPERANLMALAKELGISNKVKFLGVRNDISEILNVLDIYVQPSLREGLPMVILEAMACGVPVVAAKAGGIPSVIQHGETGFLLETTNENELADMLKAILVRPISGKQGGIIELGAIVKNAQKLVEEKYSAYAMAEAYAKLYRELNSNCLIGINSIFLTRK